MSVKMAISTTFSAINEVSTAVKKMTRDVGGLGVVAERTKGALRGIGKVGATVGKGIGIVSAGVAIAGKSFIEAGAEVEKYKTTLETMLGSQEAANKRFAEYQKFNLKTPFELSEIVDLGNSLQALGRYSLENMSMLGDFAAASGKPVEQASRAFAKLASGQKGIAVDMFRDLLITTQDWVKATGKGVSKSGEMLATTEEMLAALPKILKDKGFAGMMENQSKTFNGRLSNMKDALFQFRAAMGSAILAPAGRMADKVGAFLSDLTDQIGTNAGAISEFFGGFFDMFDTAFTAAIGLVKQLMPLIGRIAPIITNAFQSLLPIFTKLLDAAMPVINQIMDGFVRIMPSIIQIANAIGKILIPVFQLLEPLLKIIIPVIDLLAKALTGLAELINAVFTPIIKFITWVADKIPGLASLVQSALQTASPGAPGGYEYGNDQGAYAEMYGPTPISSQTSTINRNTRNTLDVNVNNNSGLPVSARAIGPAAPPITVRTGSMRGGAR